MAQAHDRIGNRMLVPDALTRTKGADGACSLLGRLQVTAFAPPPRSFIPCKKWYEKTNASSP